MFVTIQKKSSADNSASVTTFRAIVTTRFSARVLITVSVNVVLVNVTTVGKAMLANAAVPSTHAKLPTGKSARAMARVSAEDASVRLRRTSDTQESTARSVQLVQDAVTS